MRSQNILMLQIPRKDKKAGRKRAGEKICFASAISQLLLL